MVWAITEPGAVHAKSENSLSLVVRCWYFPFSCALRLLPQHKILLLRCLRSCRPSIPTTWRHCVATCLPWRALNTIKAQSPILNHCIACCCSCREAQRKNPRCGNSSTINKNKFSPSFHGWLTPEQFGAQFGPAAADVETITSWLADQGFRVNRISAGNTVIEFDGTAGQVRKAFHTQIHRYVVAGQEHTANASDPEIPAALAPVVAGVVSLNNFPAVSHALSMGTFQKSRATGAISPVAPSPLAARPFYTPPSTSNTFLLAPADFATIYNVTPLWNTGIDGTGQSIAIIGDSNINVSDIQNFRALFGLSNNFTTDNVIVDGIDPGILKRR